jgi:hypothetical protein
VDHKYHFVIKFIYLGLLTFSFNGCNPQQNTSLPYAPSPTKSYTPIPSSTSTMTQSVTPIPSSIEKVPFPFNPLPMVEAAECNWDEPSELSPFRFGGKILMAEFIPVSSYDDPEKYNLWKFSSNADYEQYIGSYELLSRPPSGPPDYISPNAQWMMTVSTWNPLAAEPPTPIQITSIDGSQSFLIERDPAWDITLGWYDNERIIMLPSNGNITDIFLLNVFTLEVEPHPNVQSAINRTFQRAHWSPWRERSGAVVFFNHQLSQLFYSVDYSGILQLSNINESIPLWSSNSYFVFGSFEGSATWSADDQYVAFPVRFGQVEELFILNKEGNLNQYTYFSKFIKGRLSIYIIPNASWFQDSTKVAFLTITNSPEDVTTYNIYILDLERKEIRDMCTNGLPITFSPDGRYLLYTRGEGYVDLPDPYYIQDTLTGRKWLVNESKLRNVIGWLPDP